MPHVAPDSWTVPRAPPRSAREAWLVAAALVVVLAGSLSLNLHQNGFPLGWHFDEPRKVRFIQEHEQNFFHPVLMLQVGRVAAVFVQPDDAQSVVEMGRTLTAVFATLNVFACFLLFRRIAGPSVGLATAAAVAVMPGLVVHAHYLKEDLYLTPLLMLSLHAFLLHQDRRRARTLAWWGVATGLALSTKYVALLLPLTYWLVHRGAALPDPAAHAREFRRMLAIAGVTFLVVNFPAFLAPEVFIKGLEFETRHAVKGHFVKVWPWEHLFTFHLRYSLVPAMTWLWLALAGVGIAGRLWLVRRPAFHDRVLLTFLVLWVGAAELSPLKPFPGFVRYVLPAVPILAYYAVLAIVLAGSRIAPSTPFLRLVLLLLALVWPTYESVQLVRHLEDESRARVGALLPPGARVLYERYTSPREDVHYAAEIPVEELRARGVEYLVTSSFVWERMLLGESMGLQRREVYVYADRYRALFATCPYVTVPPTYRSYVLSNPELRIVHVSECLDELVYPPPRGKGKADSG